MKRDFKILTSFWFIIGLTTLLLNDFVLKGLYGNWLTGKLSDFAGLFIFPLFWCAIFPRHQNKIFWLTGILFVFWKSMYSQPLIDTWNGLDILKINRTVDYSDLIALIILPFAFEFNRRKDRIINLKTYPIIPLVVSVFAFCATSYQKDFDYNKTYNFPFSKTELVLS